jgi:hypothetical protein|tara:strand:- start:309 stop:1001 length:693 start_codon:yes stop_codon:yes gene_type:complete
MKNFIRIITEAQEQGSAGQAKGKDSMPKAKPGRTKHPLKDKLVGEADKNKLFKARDPNWRDMEALRKSGASGSHKDKKKLAKQGYSKHKSKSIEEDPKSALGQLAHGFKNYNKLSALDPDSTISGGVKDLLSVDKEPAPTKTDKKANSPKSKASNGRLNPDKIPPNNSQFEYEGNVYSFNQSKYTWQSKSKADLTMSQGIELYNKTPKDKRQFVRTFESILYNTLIQLNT